MAVVGSSASAPDSTPPLTLLLNPMSDLRRPPVPRHRSPPSGEEKHRASPGDLSQSGQEKTLHRISRRLPRQCTAQRHGLMWARVVGGGENRYPLPRRGLLTIANSSSDDGKQVLRRIDASFSLVEFHNCHGAHNEVQNGLHTKHDFKVLLKY